MSEVRSVNETVTRMIRDFPSLFENRTQALHHLFCVVGGGYEWHEGGLVDVFEHLTEERTEEEALRPVNVCEPFEWLKDGDPDEYQQMVSAADTERARLKAIRDSAAELAMAPGPLGCDPYPPSPRTPLNEMPDNALPDWVAAAAEIAAVVDSMRAAKVNEQALGSGDPMEQLGQQRVVFWSCLNRAHKTVTWTDGVASCDTCDLSSEMTGRFMALVREHERSRVVEHIAQLVEKGCPYPDEGEHPCDYPLAAQIVRDAFKETRV